MHTHVCTQAEVLDLDAILDVYGNRKTMRRSEVATGVKMVKEAHTEVRYHHTHTHTPHTAD